MPVCGFREYIFLKTRIAQEGVSADAEFVIVLDVFFIFTSIIECYKKGSAVYTYNTVNSLTIPLTAQEET